MVFNKEEGKNKRWKLKESESYPELIGPEEVKKLETDPVCSLGQHGVEEIFEYHEETFEYLKQ